MPVLAQVGDEWHRGPARIAHEHLMSSTIRNILGSFLRLYARPEGSIRLLFATMAGERHEIGTLGAAMLAASSGLGVAYLGPDLPAREIVESVRPAGAQVLVLGLTATSARKATERELRAIVRISRRRSRCGRADAAPDITPHSSARGDWFFATTTNTNKNSSASVRAPCDPRRIPRKFLPLAFIRISRAHSRCIHPSRLICVCSGHHRRGRDHRRGGERGRSAGRRRARVRSRHRILRHQRRSRRLSYRRIARGVVSAGDTAPGRPSVRQRSGGRTRRAGRHRGNHATRGGGRPGNRHRDRGGVPGAGGGEELGLPGPPREILKSAEPCRTCPATSKACPAS